MNECLFQAITNLNIISFEYEGFHRVVEPFAYGINASGEQRMSAYQIGGQSSSNRIPEWKFFKLEEMTNIHNTDLSFAGIRDGYRKGDRRLSKIFIEV